MLPSRADIGRLMGEQPEVYWAVMNADESAYCIAFDRSGSVNPKREAEEWFDRHKREHPENVEQNGYHVVRCERWPDYLGEHGDCAASSRFINWAFRQSVFAEHEKLLLAFSLIQPGKSVQEALAGFICGQQGPDGRNTK